jgi:hypothetical protein
MLVLIELLPTSHIAISVLAAVSTDNGQHCEGREPAKISVVAP